MFIDDYIANISLKEELKNIKEQLKTVQDENTKLKIDIDLHCKANAEKTEKIKRLSEELDALKYPNEDKIKALEAKIEMPENDRSELLAIHTADVETINKLNGTISTLIERVYKSDEENQDLKKRVQQLKYIIEDLNKKLYE